MMKTTKDMIRAFNRLAKGFNVKMIDSETFKGSKAALLTLTSEMTGDSNPLPLLAAEFAKIEATATKQHNELEATEAKVKAKLPSVATKKASPALTGDELQAAIDKAPKRNVETVVARGAYESETEALYKTGHTTHGKRSDMRNNKPEAIVHARFAKAAAKSAKAPSSAPSNSVAEAAATLKLSPKVLRAKLRKLGMNAPYPAADKIVKAVKA